MSRTTINIAREFSEYPAGRKPHDISGGENFRKKFLVDKLKNGNPVEIDFTGVYLCAPSFLEEAFGKLVSKEGIPKEVVWKLLFFTNTDSDKYKSYIEAAKRYIEEAEAGLVK